MFLQEVKFVKNRQQVLYGVHQEGFVLDLCSLTEK